MVQEALHAVKVAEEKAVRLVEESGIKAQECIEAAQVDAAVLQEQTKKLAKEEAQEALQNAKIQMQEIQEDTERKVEIEIETLKEKASKEEEVAIDSILKNLY